MGFCIMGNIMTSVDNNYKAAMARYAQKRQAVLKQITSEYNIAGEEFINVLKQNFQENMSQSMTSNLTGRSVKIDTILQHLYKAAENQVYALLENNTTELENELIEIKQLQQEAENGTIQEKKIFDQQINNIITRFINEMSLNNVWEKYLPELMSGDNKRLAASQVLGYCKSIFKREIQKKISANEVSQVIHKHPAIILGYIREDALADAATKAIEQFKMNTAKAQTVGAEQSHIDILISLTSGTSSISKDLMKGLLQQLDSINNDFSVVGDSIFENNEFLGMQSKAWNLYAPSNDVWNPNALGRRAELFNDFVSSLSSDLEGSRGWHQGVLYISYHLEEAMGANTVIYATGKQILWTDELLQTMLNNNKYFAFRLNSENQITPTIVLADHYE